VKVDSSHHVLKFVDVHVGSSFIMFVDLLISGVLYMKLGIEGEVAFVFQS